MINYAQYSELLACPKCYGDLQFNKNNIVCIKCGYRYFYKEGIPVLINNDHPLTPVSLFAEFYDRPDVYKTMNLRLSNNAASRRMYILEQVIKKYRPKSFLDISVGSGILSQIAHKAGSDIIFGVDISIEMLLNTKNKLGPSFIPIMADARFLPFKNNSVDFVTNCNLIEHIENWKDCINKSIDISNKIVCISTDTYSLDSRINYRKFGEHPAGHLHIFNHFSLKNLLSQRGNLEYSIIYTFLVYHWFSELANFIINKKKYGVGKNLTIAKLIPKYFHLTKHKSLPAGGHIIYFLKIVYLAIGRIINNILNFLEKDSLWIKKITKKNYSLASFFVLKK